VAKGIWAALGGLGLFGLFSWLGRKAGAAERSREVKDKVPEGKVETTPKTTTGKRKEEFPPSGKRIIASRSGVEEEWKKATSRIPVRFALGTAEHESNFTINEVDTEPSGFVSKGIYQISDEEAAGVGEKGVNLLDLTNNSRVFAKMMGKKLDAIYKALGSEPKGTEVRDQWAYLFIAHNQGLGAATKTIKAFGMNWERYKERNLKASAGTDKEKFWKKVVAYGDDVI